LVAATLVATMMVVAAFLTLFTKALPSHAVTPEP